MSKSIEVLNDDNFDQVTQNGVVLVDFWAPWCGPCRMQLPILEQVADQLTDTATVAKLNVDDSPNSAAKFGVRSIPTLILFHDGKPEQQFVGVQSAETLLGAISALRN